MTVQMHQVQEINLMQGLPPGWRLKGLSEPYSDGTNFYRRPTEDKSELSFNLGQLYFIQFQYQLYAHHSAIGTVKFDNQIIDVHTFSAHGSKIERMSFFAPAGPHKLQIDYSCSDDNCIDSHLRQYWTRIKLVSNITASSNRLVGISARQLRLNTPASNINIQGTGPLLFDDVNYYREMMGRPIRLSWPVDIRPINMNFHIESSLSSNLVIRTNGKEIYQKRLAPHQGLIQTIPIYDALNSNYISIELNCIKKVDICGNLYQLNITGYRIDHKKIWTAILTISILLAILYRFLR